MDTTLVLEQLYDAPLASVWQALTDPNQMREWYFPQLRTFEPVEGAAFLFAHDGSAYQKEWRVTRVVAGRSLAHSWVYKGYPGHSEVTFALAPAGTQTRLTLTHTGLASFPPDPHFARQRFEDGWHRILGSRLKQHLAAPRSA